MNRSKSGGACGGRDIRGQTLHDYVVGVSVFIIATGLVLGLLPGVIAPHTDEGATADSLTATHIAERMVANLSRAGAPNTLDGRTLTAFMSLDQADLRDRFGLRKTTFVNITLTDLSGDSIYMTAGATAATEETQRAGRIVTVTSAGLCDPGCRVTVRVW